VGCGPKPGPPGAVTASTTPRTKGLSGPITTRSAEVLIASSATSVGSMAYTSGTSAIAAMPGLPGSHTSRSTLGSSRSARQIACSRAPPPMTRTFTTWRSLCERAQQQGLIAGRTHADHAERCAGHVLQRLDVFAGVLRQVVELPRLGDVFAPARELLVDRVRVMEVGLRHRHLVDDAAVRQSVADAYRDRVKVRQNVELGQHEVGDSIDPRGIARYDRVVPATAPWPASCGAEFRSDDAQLLAVRIFEFCWERPGTHARRVRLDDRDDAFDAGRSDARARARAAGRRVRRRDERVGAMVDVEQGCLAGLEENGVTAVERIVQQQAGVLHHRLKTLGVLEEFSNDCAGVDGRAVVDLHQQLVLGQQGAFDFLPQDLFVEEVLNAHADPRHLVGVGGPDAAAGGADLRLTEKALADLVDRAVVASYDVGIGADDETAGGDAPLLEHVDFTEEHTQVNHNPVADDRRDRWREDAAGQQVHGVLLVLDHDGVAGVVAAVEPHAVVDLVAEQAGGLALTLVTPLGADEHDRGHGCRPFSGTSQGPEIASATGASCEARLPDTAGFDHVQGVAAPEDRRAGTSSGGWACPRVGLGP